MDPNTDVMSSSYLKIKTLVGRGEEEEEDVERGSGVKVKVKAKFVDTQLKKNRLSVGEGVSEMKGGGAVAQPPPPCCLVESCRETLAGCKKYYERHRVCEVHGKAPVVLVDGLRQRFCQQCSRFHELSEFDKTKRSCRKRLAGHNERRRKSSLEFQKHGTVQRDLNNEHTEVRSNGNKAFDVCCKSL